MISKWSGEAFNQDPDSANEIHGDELARQFGFEGGLVPGVTISAYLTHPAVERWGLDFLTNGYAHVRVVSPLYDGEQFTVATGDETETSYTATLLRPGGVVSANAVVKLEDDLPPSPRRHGDHVATKHYRAPPASRTLFEKLRHEGCLACRYTWYDSHMMGTYLRNRSLMPELLRGETAYANMSFILGISNWIADGNAHMNPWVHLETESQNYAPIPDGTKIIAEMAITDLFEKKGHEFFDADVTLFDEADDQCLTTITLRAIYQLRAK
jgi:hypothetical protein